MNAQNVPRASPLIITTRGIYWYIQEIGPLFAVYAVRLSISIAIWYAIECEYTVSVKMKLCF